MANHRLAPLLAFGFISGCFCLGIGMGVLIRVEILQPSDAATTYTNPQFPFAIPEPTQPPSDTITIKFVGDTIPDPNFPHYSNQL
jgi:hypothetical protein